MAIPYHRDSCVTKAFPTHCPDCQEDVWFFSCNCGSKVYFDQLSWPWDRHKCKERVIREAIELVKTSDRLSEEEIYRRIEMFAKERSWTISDDIIELLDFELNKRKQPFKKIEVRDLSNTSVVDGTVMQINRDVSFIKRYDLNPNNPIHKGLARDLLTRSYSEIYVRQAANEYNQSNEFVIFAERGYLKSNPIMVTKTILAHIKKINTVSDDLWEIISHKCY